MKTTSKALQNMLQIIQYLQQEQQPKNKRTAKVVHLNFRKNV